MLVQFLSTLLLSAFSLTFPFSMTGPQSNVAGESVPEGGVCERPAFEGSRISRGLQTVSDTVVVDFDRDGRLDIANQSGPFQVLSIQLGTGNGYFGESIVIDPASTGFQLISADFNNDGNADLLTPARIYLGNGDGSFQVPRLLSLGSNANQFVTGDFNGDDNIDIAGQISSSSRNVEAFYGDGTGRFGPATVVDFLTGNIDSFVAADMNGDGISDLVATLTGNTVGVALGSSSGAFGTPVSYPVGGVPGASRIATGDVDSDGDLDVVTSTVDFFSDTEITTLLNNGSGALSAQPQFLESSSNLVRLLLVDINFDNKLDLLATNTSGVLVRRFGNNNGTFEPSRRLPGIPGQVKMFFEDFTGDGIRDLGLNGTGVGTPLFGVLVNDAMGNLGPVQQDIGTDEGPTAMATADFNEDGKMDVVVANEQLSFWVGFGDGVGGFASPLTIPVTRTPRAVLALDLNNDGHQDIVGLVQNSTESTARSWVAFGNGDGTFAPEVLSEIFGNRTPVLLDFDRDGFLDIAVPAGSTPNRVGVYRGFGAGAFVFQRYIDVPGQPRSLASADFDGDGFKDLAVLAGSVSVFLNSGNFAPLLIGSFPAGQTTGNILTSDLNGDNIPDLATTTDTIGGGIGNPGKVVILLGVGNGGFGAPTEYLVGRGPGAIATADFDGDGNLDLSVANSGYNLGSAADTRVTVMYGNGQGVYPRMRDFAAANFPRGIGAIDIDTDGDIDIVTPDWGQSRLTLLENTCLAAPPSPLPALNANADIQVNEGDAGDTTLNLSVTMSAPSTVPVRVRYYTAPFLGIPGLREGEVLRPEEETLTTAARRDYISAAGTLEFAPGETSRTIQFTVRGDLIDEFDEYVSVFLRDSINASIGDNQTIITIIDNDGPPSISIGDLTSAEGNTGDTVFLVPITPSTVSEKPISMQYVTGGGTATPNVDYRFAQTMYTLPPGQSSGAIPVAIIADSTVEPDETFLVQISEPVNATIDDSSATVNIANDDIGGSVEFSAATYSGVETVGLIPVTLTRTGGSGGGVSVRFRTQAGTATPGQDYVEKVVTVVFGDNETSRTVQVEVLRDELDEPDETVNLTLDQPSGVTLGPQSSAILTIQDLDNPPDLSIQDGQVLEGDSGTTNLKLFFILSRPTQRVVTVNYATADVTATAGSDYDAASGTFAIEPGVTRVALNIVVHGDTTFELNETLHLNLSNAANANLIDNQAVGTIINDEASSETSLEFVSLNQAGTGSANSDSGTPAASADGNIVAFESFASNIAGTDTNGQVDIYVRNLKLGQTKLASINAAGTNAGNCGARLPVVSGNGRYVAFISCATDLVTTGAGVGDFDGYAVYLRDLQTDQTRLISLNTSGAMFSSHVWALSHDGRYVVLESNDIGITPTPDPLGTSDLFVRDTVSNTTQLVTINAAGTATGNASSGNGSLNRDVHITPDGRYILFPSLATDLVTLPHAGGTNLYVRDLVSQTTTAASVNAAGTALVGTPGSGSISDDGRYVFFSSTSNTVAPNDPNTASDVFRRDMQTGTNLLVSVNLAGTGPGNAASSMIEGSADGRYAAFVSSASDISSSPDTNTFPDVYWRDITSGETRLISVNAAGTSGGNQFSDKPRISGNGQRVLFFSAANDLIEGVDGNSNFDQYLRDVSLGRTFLVSGSLGGTSSGNQPTIDGVITTDGSRVLFPSSASNLLPNDINGLASDVFAFSVLATDTGDAAPFDFDGDGKTDIGIFRPSVGEWWINHSGSGNTLAFQFGATTDRIVPADYTGDGKSDIAFFRPSSGEWYILRSENNSFYSFPFGTSGDVPAPADYDADGMADPAVFRPSTATWFIQRSSDNGTTIAQFGATGDHPVAADYDGDGKADLAIYRPSNGQWWLNRSTAGVLVTTFGNSTDKPVQGDYTGDGKADVAFWRPSTGEWFVLRSEDMSFYSVPFGSTGDIPAPGDYDGDGRFDTTVFRPSSATWFSQRTTAGTLIQQFGANGDQPIPNAFVR